MLLASYINNVMIVNYNTYDMNALRYDIMIDIIYSYYLMGAYIIITSISAPLRTIVKAGRSWNRRRLLIVHFS